MEDALPPPFKNGGFRAVYFMKKVMIYGFNVQNQQPILNEYYGEDDWEINVYGRNMKELFDNAAIAIGGSGIRPGTMSFCHQTIYEIEGEYYRRCDFGFEGESPEDTIGNKYKSDPTTTPDPKWRERAQKFYNDVVSSELCRSQPKRNREEW